MAKANKKPGKRLYEMGGNVDATKLPVYQTASIKMLGNPPTDKQVKFPKK